MVCTTLRRWVSGLKGTPLHPQWFAFRHNAETGAEVAMLARGIVLDIGCADMKIRRYLDAACDYIGLDHYLTGHGLYRSRPSVFADAAALPFASTSVDCVLLLDVLEHVPDPRRVLAEIGRVVRRDGLLILQVPFLYPIHDAPYDFQRWTVHGLKRLASEHGFRVERQHSIGEPLETAALAFNIALSKTVLNALQRRNPLSLLSIFLLPIVLVNNLLSWLISRIAPADGMMPHAYRLVLVKDRSCT
ncbi:MAG TPA: methyltransferase domain-containing protein [Acidiferrobacterales bacterium]|jgi:SAM-dependent methyltransferase